jgi:hypothetical protein
MHKCTDQCISPNEDICVNSISVRNSHSSYFSEREEGDGAKRKTNIGSKL